MPGSTEAPAFGQVWTYDEVTLWLLLVPSGASPRSWTVLYVGSVGRDDGAALMRSRMAAGHTVLDSMNLDYGEWRRLQ